MVILSRAAEGSAVVLAFAVVFALRKNGSPVSSAGYTSANNVGYRCVGCGSVVALSLRMTKNYP
jgi:hypothetical protein